MIEALGVNVSMGVSWVTVRVPVGGFGVSVSVGVCVGRSDVADGVVQVGDGAVGIDEVTNQIGLLLTHGTRVIDDKKDVRGLVLGHGDLGHTGPHADRLHHHEDVLVARGHGDATSAQGAKKYGQNGPFGPPAKKRCFGHASPLFPLIRARCTKLAHRKPAGDLPTPLGWSEM